MKWNSVVRWLQLVLLNFLLISCGRPGAADHQRDVANLPKIFSVLKTLKVKAYRNQDWCQNISYKGGNFSSNLEASTCNLFEDKPVSMNDRAKQDFQAVSNAMATTGVSIHYLSAKYDSSDRLIEAEFNLSTICRCSYVYQPQYTLPNNMGGEMEFTAINPDWYFVWEDWN
jgi:hypothetical protein